jgi:DNA mismatch repair protein MutS2
VATLGVEGEVRSIHGSEAEVEVRGKRLRVPIRSLAVSVTRPAKAQSRVKVQVNDPGGPLDEINLIGCRVDDALVRAGKHLDQVLMGDLRVVRFIHGHGTGQLRRAIAEFLSAHPLVRRFAPAAPEDGGNGVTLAELKD